MEIRWIIRNKLGTAPAELLNGSEYNLLDVRDMVDKIGNPSLMVKAKIEQGVKALNDNKPLVVCCDYGISRSNAIAAGIVSMYYGKTLSEAVNDVISATGEKEIKIDVLDIVRKALGQDKKTDKYTNNILITGATGFVGKDLTQIIDNRHTYYTISSTEINLAEGAVELDTYVKENNIAKIIHLASPKISLSNKSLGLTLTMLRNVLEVCTKNNVKLIYPSSWIIYFGYKSENMLVDENVAPNPNGAYSETKWLCELLIQKFIEYNSLKCAILRTCSLYGIDSGRPKFLWSFINSSIKSNPINIHYYFNGIPKADLLHVSDFCKAILAVIDSDYTGYLNLGSGELLSLQQIAELICQKTNSKSEIKKIEIAEYSANIQMDIAKAKETINWEPLIKFSDGINGMIKQNAYVRKEK